MTLEPDMTAIIKFWVWFLKEWNAASQYKISTEGFPARLLRVDFVWQVVVMLLVTSENPQYLFAKNTGEQ